MREVPELMERTPQEARQRWLRLTGRLGGGVNGADGREEEGGDRTPGSPALDSFYVQVGVGKRLGCGRRVCLFRQVWHHAGTEFGGTICFRCV